MATKGTCSECGKEAILVRCLTCEKQPKLCNCKEDVKYRMLEYHVGEGQPTVTILPQEGLDRLSTNILNDAERYILNRNGRVSFDTANGQKFFFLRLDPKHICGKCYDRRIRQDPKTLRKRNSHGE